MNPVISAIVFLTVLLDQVSKFFVLQILNPGESNAVIKNFFHLTLVRNSGAAFGIFRNQTIFFIAVSAIAVTSIFIFIRNKKDSFFLRDIGLALILGGAVGNLIDRLRFGYVVDFLDFRVWPVFNVADSAITVGTALIIFSITRRTKNSKCKTQNQNLKFKIL